MVLVSSFVTNLYRLSLAESFGWYYWADSQVCKRLTFNVVSHLANIDLQQFESARFRAKSTTVRLVNKPTEASESSHCLIYCLGSWLRLVHLFGLWLTGKRRDCSSLWGALKRRRKQQAKWCIWADRQIDRHTSNNAMPAYYLGNTFEVQLLHWSST